MEVEPGGDGEQAVKRREVVARRKVRRET